MGVIMDPISDMFVRIRNAAMKFHEKVDMPSSKIKIAITKIFKEEGYILDYKNININGQNILRIYLKYITDSKKNVICGIKRISKSSLRIYSGYKSIPKTVGGLGVTIISTSKGLMTDKQSRNKKIGGEVIGCIW
ncbi:MAG: 30S ribosomal protein S8 [Endomicrobium sp.]|jgi:small subunit ribosomal protein S8|nr:30S ribosomal protein S8 [Endomicrobium sp.]